MGGGDDMQFSPEQPALTFGCTPSSGAAGSSAGVFLGCCLCLVQMAANSWSVWTVEPLGICLNYALNWNSPEAPLRPTWGKPGEGQRGYSCQGGQGRP